MIKLLLDSTIEVWRADYINAPKRRALEDRDKEIQQIETIPGSPDFFIVEVFRPEGRAERNEDETD